MWAALVMRRAFVWQAIAVFLMAAMPQLAQAASFDCRRAVTSIERAICARQELNELDTRLGEIFRKALSLQVDNGPLLRDQRAWLSNRERACGSLGAGVLERCLLEQFNGRIAILASIVSRDGSLSPPNTADVWTSVPTSVEPPKVNSISTSAIAPANLPPSIKDTGAPSPVPLEADRIQITPADKINATIKVFTSPQLFVTMAFLGLLFWGEARAKRTARSIPTKLGRLGLVLHWAALAVAAVLLGTAGLIATQAKQLDDGPVFGAAALGVLALVIWLIGKALRYILTGPTEPIQPATASVSVPPSAPQATQQASMAHRGSDQQ
jgi:uncharacterized protein